MILMTFPGRISTQQMRVEWSPLRAILVVREVLVILKRVYEGRRKMAPSSNRVVGSVCLDCESAFKLRCSV